MKSAPEKGLGQGFRHELDTHAGFDLCVGGVEEGNHQSDLAAASPECLTALRMRALSSGFPASDMATSSLRQDASNRNMASMSTFSAVNSEEEDTENAFICPHT